VADEIARWPALPKIMPGTLPGIALAESEPARILHLARPIEGTSLSAMLSGFTIAELPRTGRSAGAGARLLLGTGRGRWWLIDEEAPATEGKGGSLAAAFGVAVDIGDAWCRFRIAGQAVPDLLAKGSSLDLDPRVFPAGTCALAVFAQLHTLLHRAHRHAHFDLYCGRSYARTLEEWLIEAAAEFGCKAIRKGGATTETRT